MMYMLVVETCQLLYELASALNILKIKGDAQIQWYYKETYDCGNICHC